jgi:hypothetical protein
MHNELANVLKPKKQTVEPGTASYKTGGQAATIEGGRPKLSNGENVIEYLE